MKTSQGHSESGTYFVGLVLVVVWWGFAGSRMFEWRVDLVWWRRCVWFRWHWCWWICQRQNVWEEGGFDAGRMCVVVVASYFSLWRRRILLDLAEAAGGIDRDRMFGRRASLMLVELASWWSPVSVSGGMGAG